jgi:hypothetical protein
MKKLFKVLSWIIAVFITAVILLLEVIYLLPGYDLYAVRSDSMQPLLAAGAGAFKMSPRRSFPRQMNVRVHDSRINGRIQQLS